MLLYKYLPLERIGFFSDSLLRYSPAVALNDPFECYPAITSEEDEKAFSETLIDDLRRMAEDAWNDEELRKMHAGGLSKPEFIEKFVQSNSNLWSAYVKKTASELLYPVATSLGILSLSEIGDSSLMWGHYSGGHTGFVLAFNTDHSYFLPDSNGFGVPYKIHYSTRRVPWRFVGKLAQNLAWWTSR